MFPEKTDDLQQQRAQWRTAIDPNTTGDVLKDLVINASVLLLERIAEHPNTPQSVLTKLSVHLDSNVRSAVTDNANASEEVILRLCSDQNPDVRFSLAENHKLSVNILKMIAADDNPYVAERAKKTLRRLEAQLPVTAGAISAEKTVALPQQGEVFMPAGERLTILAIEDNPADSKLLEKMLAKRPFHLECADRLSTALPRLANGGIDIILLDLSLPDAQGLDCFYQVHCGAPHIPIVVLTGLEDESVGSQAMQAGAQDYLVKGQVSAVLLTRSIRYAIERHQTESRLKQLNDSLERRVIQLATANQELNKLAQALALSNEQALQASNFKSQFVARVSHDIRSPISAVLGITELLLQDDSNCNVEDKELIALIDESARSQLTLLNEVLDLSKLEAGKVELENVNFYPLALVEDIAELFAASAIKEGVSLLTCVDPAIQPVLKGDPTRLHEILLNLTNNAVKFTPSGGEVVLRATQESQDDRCVTVRFSVTDSGIGMSETESKRLFEPFVQMHTAQKNLGTGLGLSICKRLVDLMEGQIGVESMPGNGATFWFTVRLNRAENNYVSGRRALPVPTSLLLNVRVLIVDHNSTAREIIKRYVHAAGGRTNGTAASAEEALELLHHAEVSNDPYDVAVIDLEASTSNSFELAEAIQQDPTISATRLIFLTSFDQRRKGEQAWSAGFSAYLTKPIKQWNLLDCIAEVVHPNIQLPMDSEPTLRLLCADIAGRILVAEDDAIMRKVLVQQLTTKLGVQVDAVANGRQAVDAASRANYALILMDCNMPEMTGMEATRAIRKAQSNLQHTPIIAVTSGGPGQERKNCIEAGMDDYLIKPVPLEQLYEAVARWLSPKPGQKPNE